MTALGDSLNCATFRGPAGASSTFVPAVAHGPGVPLFLVPGFGLDGRCFGRLSPIATSRRTVFWNLPNELPEHGGLTALARLCLDHADRVGMPRRFVIGGSSLGGTIALAAALEAPERCAGLILFGSSASWRELGPRLRFARMLLPVLPARGFHRRLATILFGPAGRSDDLDALRRQAEHRTKRHAATVTSLLHEGGSYDLGHRLHEIAAPTLVLHDPRERVIPFYAAESLLRIRRSRCVEVPRSGHLPYVSDPAACLAALVPFLAEIDGRESAAERRL
ncbi:MAG: alpha/beta hydrolase [Planctomycetes bacterium]|nr:alpha/beta hydrolase [Planctomycetota bacterium]